MIKVRIKGNADLLMVATMFFLMLGNLPEPDMTMLLLIQYTLTFKQLSFLLTPLLIQSPFPTYHNGYVK